MIILPCNPHKRKRNPSSQGFSVYDFSIGEEFEVRGLSKQGNTVLFSEYCTLFESVDILTDENGNRPTSIASNDSVREYVIHRFDRDELARVPVKRGYYYIHAYRESSDRIGYMAIKRLHVQFIVMEVMRITARGDGLSPDSIVKMQVVSRFNYADQNRIPEKFKQAAEYVMENMIDNNAYQGSITPYSINDSKEYDIRLFIDNYSDGFISYRGDKSKYVLNTDSMENLNKNRVGGRRTSGKFMKVYYDKKYKDSKKIIVDGREISMITRFDVEHSKNALIRYYNLKNFNNLYKITTASDYHFYAFVYSNDDIRAICISNDGGYSTIKLNQYEIDMITEKELVTN